MKKRDIELLCEAYTNKAQIKTSNNYGDFSLTELEKNIVDAYIGRTSFSEFLEHIKTDDEELYNDIINNIVFMNIKDPDTSNYATKSFVKKH